MSESADLPPLGTAEILQWEDLLTRTVRAISDKKKQSRGLEDLNSFIQELLKASTEGLRGWLASKMETPFWIEVFLWIEGLPKSIRPLAFWRTFQDPTSEESQAEHRDWLYNELFAAYYQNWFRGYVGLSQLQYEYEVKEDFEFHFLPSGQGSESLRNPGSRSLIIRLDMIGPELNDACDLLKTRFQKPDRTRPESLCLLLDKQVEIFVRTYRNREELFAEGDWARFSDGLDALQAKLEKNDKNLRDSVLAGIFLLYLLFVFDRGNNQQAESIHFLRSNPNLPESAVKASLILATSYRLSLDYVQGCRALGRMLQHVLSEEVVTSYGLEEARNAAIRAAAAGIIARNMSHNIGSHVMPRSKMEQILARLRELYTKYQVGPHEMAGDLKGRLDDYIQQKADFLAEISSEPLGGVKTGLFFRDVLLPFMEITTLIDNIAANEGFGYRAWNESSLRLRCFVHVGGERQEITLRYTTTNGTPGASSVVPYGLAMNTNVARRYLDDATIEHEECDAEVVLPGPVGEYALYGILENLIRNAAKHNPKAWLASQKDRGFALEINLELRDYEIPDPNYWRLEIWDNVTEADSRRNQKLLREKIRGYLSMDLVSGEDKAAIKNRIRSEAWGLAEVMICANLLAGRGGLKYDPNLLWVEPQAKADGGDGGQSATGPYVSRLVYGIRLPKVKKALLLGSGYSVRVADLQRYGIVGAASLEEVFGDRAASSKLETSAIQFAVLDETQLNSEKPHPLEDYRHRLPFRVIRFGAPSPGSSAERRDLFLPKDPIELVSSEGSDAGAAAIMSTLWTRWLCGKKFACETPGADGNSPLVRIDLYLDLNMHLQADKAHAQRWEAAAVRFNQQSGAAFTIAVWAKEGQTPVCLTGSEQVSARHRIVFDRHGQLISKIDNLRASDAYILFDKASPDFTPIFHAQLHQAADRSWFLPYQMLEAGLLRILVVDERIAERALRNFGVISAQASDARKVSEQLVGQAGVEPLYWHVAQAAGVTIITHILLPGADSAARETRTGEINLDSALHPSSVLGRRKAQEKGASEVNGMGAACPCAVLDLREEPEAWVSYDAVELRHAGRTERGPTFDLAVVHQGVLDGLPQHLSARSFIERLQKNVAPWVVVESGRGIPPGVRHSKDRFIPFSVLDHSLNGLRVAKLTLCQRLMDRTRKD